MKTYEQNWADRSLTVHSLNVLTDIDSPNIKEIRKSVNETRKQTFEGLKTVEQYWTSLSDDGVISPVEKQILRREMDNIQRSFSAVTTQATALGFSGPVLQDYTDTYEDLRVYIFDTLKLFDNIEEETAIDDRTAFNTYFSNYFYMESFVMLAITQGILDTVNIRVLQNLLEEGSEGETALYHGGLYQYTDGRWKAISTGNYKGAKDELPAPEEDSFFLASVDFVIEDVLVINGEELLVNGEELLIKRLFKKGIIYYVQDGVWYSESDKTNWRYAAAFADVLNVTGELPQIFQDGLDALQDQIDVINDTITEQAASLADEIEARQGQYTIINGDLVQINSDITDIISRADGQEEDLEQQAQDLLDQAAALRAQAAELASQAETIESQGETITSQGETIASQEQTIASQGQTITAQGENITSLLDRADALETQAQQIIASLNTKIDHLPEYLGAKLSDPTNRKDGDYYLYIGSTTGSGDSERIHVHIYRWNATTSKWDHLAPTIASYRSYYQMALTDVLQNEDVSDAAFATVFADSFFGNNATLKSLSTQTIYLRQGGYIQSDNSQYVVGELGLQIDYAGNIDANGNTHIGGVCNIDGNTHIGGVCIIDGDSEISGNTIFKGDIQAGPLSLLSETPSGETFTYTQGQSVPQYSPTNITGTYKGVTFNSFSTRRGTPDIYSYDDRWSEGRHYFWNIHARITVYIDLKNAAGNIIQTFSQTREFYKSDRIDGGPASYLPESIFDPVYYVVDSTLTYTRNISPTAKTFRLENLPTERPAGSGYVWRDGTTLRVTP
ncbi:MAG: hypothetical protein J6S67_03940 [Methanobrevibacter sp.]|nr:hypothetical protein [Methanobrevibacter sp.]